MSPRRLLILGAGRRVRETILPAVAALPELWTVEGVFARSEKTLEARGIVHRTESFDALTAARLDGIDLLYLCVAKPAVPSVLRRLVAADPARVRLLIETPVLLFKHLGALPLLDAFASVSVSEDTSTLPWMETLAAGREAGLLGAPRRVVFEHSAWRYHGLAMTRTVLQCDTIVRASRKGRGVDQGHVILRMANGAVGEISEPRDYSSGHWTLSCEGGQQVSDASTIPEGTLRLLPLVEGSRCRGFRLGDVTTALTPAESEVLGPVSAGTTATALTERLKGVGLMRLFEQLHRGQGGYVLERGLDDMVVDYLLEKLGRWRPTPLSSLRSSLGRAVLPRVLRLLSRG